MVVGRRHEEIHIEVDLIVVAAIIAQRSGGLGIGCTSPKSDRGNALTPPLRKRRSSSQTSAIRATRVSLSREGNIVEVERLPEPFPGSPLFTVLPFLV